MTSRRTILALALLAAAPQLRAETLQYAVSWVYYAVASRDGDCPQGLNPDSEGIFRRTLAEKNTPADQAAQLIAGFPNTAFGILMTRGVLDGKPADPYLYPTSVPDPKLHPVVGDVGLGFDLDGKVGPEDFVDPLTSERGVDNQFFRAIGCSRPMRAPVGESGVYQATQWNEVRDSQPAWLIEIAGVDSRVNDDDVQVRVLLAHEPAARDATGVPQTDMTYRVNATSGTASNVVRGRIVDGMLWTDSFEFYMPGEPRVQADYRFHGARMRFTFEPDGNLKGYLGGYQDWRTVYSSIALAGVALEALVSYDVPGLFYAFRSLADSTPDPETGFNTRISSTYAIEAVPAFIARIPPGELGAKR